MYAKTANIPIIKKENGLKKGLEILVLKDIGIYIVPRKRNSILGINIKYVLKKRKKRVKSNGN